MMRIEHTGEAMVVEAREVILVVAVIPEGIGQVVAAKSVSHRTASTATVRTVERIFGTAVAGGVEGRKIVEVGVGSLRLSTRLIEMKAFKAAWSMVSVAAKVVAWDVEIEVR